MTQRSFQSRSRPRTGTFATTPISSARNSPALHAYQLSIAAPKPPESSFDKQQPKRGEVLFNGKAACARCHVPPLFTEPGWPMHTADEIGIDDFQAKRSPDERYRTTPLRGCGPTRRAASIMTAALRRSDVLNHYNGHFKLGLTQAEINELANYVMSL